MFKGFAITYSLAALLLTSYLTPQFDKNIFASFVNKDVISTEQAKKLNYPYSSLTANDPFPGICAPQALMQFQDFADLPFHRMQGIQRRHGLLENHGNVIPAHAAEIAFVGIKQLFAIELDGT